MVTRYIGERITRNEDARLLTGQALFVDDVELPRHAARRVRAQPARARAHRCAIDVSAARGARRAWSPSTPRRISATIWQPGPLLVPPPPIKDIVFNQRTQVPLAKDKVRHVGEPLAIVIAESRYLAEDAAARHRRRLRAAAGGRRSRSGAARRARRASTTTSAATSPRTCARRKGDYAAAAKRADHIIRAPLPLRPRRLVADRDPRRRRAMGRARPTSSRSGTRRRRRSSSATASPAMLGLSERQVRVIAPFVGGGFGPKIMMFYPGGGADPWAAMRLDRPVKWIEDRARAFLRHHARARPDPRRRDRARPRRPHPRHQGRVSARHRRLRSLRPDRADQQPVHAARPLRRRRTTTARSPRSSPTSRS